MTRININVSTMLSDLKSYISSFKFSDFADFMGQSSSDDKFLFSTVKVYKKLNFSEMFQSIESIIAKPGCVIIPTGSERDKANCRGQKIVGFGLIIIGAFNADGYNEGMQDLADYVIEQFLPHPSQPAVRCTKRGVVYEPEGWEAIELKKSHIDAVLVRLEATDARRPESQRHDSQHFS